MYSLKTKVLEGIKRLKKSDRNWSIAVLLPTKIQMLKASNYFSSLSDNLSDIKHDVSIDSEGPELAGYLFIKLLEKFDSPEEITNQIIIHLINHLKGRKGSKPSNQSDLKLSIALESFLDNNIIRGSKRELLLKEIEQISNEIINIKLTGDPLEDWLNNVKLFNNVQHESLKNIREDSKYVRLLHKGSHLRETLGQMWKEYGYYYDASKSFQDAIQKEHLSTTVKKRFSVNIMTIHKSKGKQFNEVFLFEGFHRGRFVRDEKDIHQSRLLLRVGVTRAMSRVTILSPYKKKSEIL